MFLHTKYDLYIILVYIHYIPEFLQTILSMLNIKDRYIESMYKCLSPLKSRVQTRSWRGVLDTTLCDKVCQWFPPGTPVSSTNKTDRHNIIEILLKVVLNIINQPPSMYNNKKYLHKVNHSLSARYFSLGSH